ncbi:DUF3006 domain-containing protein [Brevibacillus reuszeri]|uniref:DUF3006 domain-containing protein n=1 Tax=Brevibacillus reuszeri TaxID=54915 RepID=UPI000CCBF883|nr:DUF3006 domain-containing protein [Brevibacillus reuszeri]
MKGIVDRFEDSFVVIEIEGKTQDIEKHKVDRDVVAGDVVTLENGIWVKDVTETSSRQDEIKKLMDSVWEDD